MSRFYVIQNKDGLSLLEYVKKYPEFLGDFQNILQKFISPYAGQGTKRLQNSSLYNLFIDNFSQDRTLYSRGFREISTLKRFYTNDDLSLLSEHYFNLYVFDTDISLTVNLKTECFVQKKLLNFLWVQNLKSLVY